MVKVDTTTKLLLDRYWALCAKRDAANAEIARLGLQEELDKTNAEIIRLQEHANNAKADIEAVRDGAAWLTLKNEIGRLASALRFTPAPGAYEEAP